MTYRVAIALAAVWLWPASGVLGQTEGVPAAAVARVDTVARRDTAAHARDTLKAAESPSGVDSVVTYSAADSIIYSIPSRTMALYGKGDIKYREMGLKAENIDINWNTAMMVAHGVPDTSDTTGKKSVGLPNLVDGSEDYHGRVISYNFKSKKGKIDLGDTEMDKGYYHGEEIKKVEPDVLYVADGRFTTCDLPEPHYFFFSPKMKVIVKDKIFARPVYLYIANVPVFALPFGVFPAQRGRRSGIIAPAYGESIQGRYLLHLGYYWAMSDYTDWNIRGDGYTGGSWVLYSDFNYNLRYNFQGGISASYKKSISKERGDPDYNQVRDFNIHVAHSQQFDPTTNLVVDFGFASGSYFQRATTDFNDLLRQNVVSNATLTKSWEGTPNSLTLNIHRDQNLQPQPGQVEISETLPDISFSRSQTFPFRSGSNPLGSGSDQWYDLIAYSYSGHLLAQRTKTTLAPGSIWDQHEGIQHSVTVNASPKLSHFTIAPFFNYTELWYDRSIRESVNDTNALVTNDVHGFQTARFYNFGVSTSTKLYGMFRPGVFGIEGIRHQIIPTLTYTYQPDFSKPKYGYYRTFIDTAGRTQQYSIFQREVFGGPPAGEQQAISLNIGNVFEMKTVSSDSAAKENKFQLLNLSAGISYNFVADSLRFSELGLNYRTSVGQLLSIGGGASFNLYKFDPNALNGSRRVNKFLLSEEGRLAQLTSFSISVGTHLSGQKHETTAGPVKTEADSLKAKGGYVGLYDKEAPDFSIPWNLDLNWNFSQNQADPRFKFTSSNLSAGLSFNLTEFWKVTASTSYDVLRKQFATPQITVYRDLHCWEMNFYWVPTGFNRQYRLEIKLKAPQLQDVKVTKQGSASGVY